MGLDYILRKTMAERAYKCANGVDLHFFKFRYLGGRIILQKNHINPEHKLHYIQRTYVTLFLKRKKGL